MYEFVQKHTLGEVRMAPYDIHFDEENVFQPDMFFILKENAFKIKDHLYGAPDLVVEVLSQSNQRYDKEEKKEVYEKYGVKEYYIVDPNNKTVISYILVNDEYVQRDTKPGEIESALLKTTFTF